MKKIYICNSSKQQLGGGFSFLKNFIRGCKGKAEIVKTWQECSIAFIAGSTMADKDEVNLIKNSGKKIILRLDNVAKNSRNRNTSTSRISKFSLMADFIIFQSQWSKEYVGNWLSYRHGVNLKKSKVIYNGVDPEFFYHKDDPTTRGETYLFSTFNTDENKRFPEAAYDFHLRNFDALKNKKPIPHLTLVGNIPGGKEYNFDFFNEEKYTYYPPIEDRKILGDIYRKNKYLYFPAYNDASPNTVGEAMACGCKPLLINPSGGSAEVVEQFNKHIITIDEMCDQYLEVM
jgi:glycosyltransferase involved in cell wall biosynthesis